LITPQEFLIIKACIQYASEELGPHCPEAFYTYLPDISVTRDEIESLVRRLKLARLMFVPTVRLREVMLDSANLHNTGISLLSSVIVEASD
jgi:hypothetical protein